MNFGTAIKTGFNKYADFSGVASRSEYWYWMLFTWLVSSVIDLLTPSATGIFGLSHYNHMQGGQWLMPVNLFSTGAPVLSGFWDLAVFVPTIAVGVRRFRDAGLNPKLMWLAVVPFGALLVLLIGVVGVASVAFLTMFGWVNGNPLSEPNIVVVLIVIGLLLFAAFLTISILFLVWLCRPSLNAEQGNRFLRAVGVAPEQSSVPNNLEN